MPHELTTIAEGPREEDGKVRFLCEACGKTTPWISPPPPTPVQFVPEKYHITVTASGLIDESIVTLPQETRHKSIHYCRGKKGERDVATRREPCFESAFAIASRAVNKVSEKAHTPEVQDSIRRCVELLGEIKQFIPEEILAERAAENAAKAAE